MNITIEFPTVLPPGYKMFKARKWAVPELGLSYEEFGFSSFQVIPTWIAETRTWSAVSNFSIMDTYGTKKLQEIQVQDGFELRVKMNWLVMNGFASSPMWTGSSKNWQDAPEYRVGTMLWGDQIFAATTETFNVQTSLGLQSCRKILPFRKIDWFRSPDAHPHLFPWACVSGPNNGISFSWGRGKIRTMLQVLDPIDYKFAGSIVPTAFYMPENWCLSP